MTTHFTKRFTIQADEAIDADTAVFELGLMEIRATLKDVAAFARCGVVLTFDSAWAAEEWGFEEEDIEGEAEQIHERMAALRADGLVVEEL